MVYVEDKISIAIKKGDVLIRKAYHNVEKLEPGFDYVDKYITGLYNYMKDNAISEIYFKDVCLRGCDRFKED